MKRNIIIEPEWREEPDFERLARALIRITQRMAEERDIADEESDDEEAA